MRTLENPVGRGPARSPVPRTASIAVRARASPRRRYGNTTSTGRISGGPPARHRTGNRLPVACKVDHDARQLLAAVLLQEVAGALDRGMDAAGGARDPLL